jgi:hypothetical protein
MPVIETRPAKYIPGKQVLLGALDSIRPTAAHTMPRDESFNAFTNQYVLDFAFRAGPHDDCNPRIRTAGFGAI